MTDTRTEQFSGRVAFITGAGSGIGRATALAFAAQGAAVTASDKSEKDLYETARLIEDQGGQALPVLCDVTRSDDVAAAVAAAVRQFGRLDFAFNNAGVEQPVAPLHEISDQDWNRILDINLRGVFYGMKHEVPAMLATGCGGAIGTPPPVRA
ncbi:SDR family NAD(P)-dependent oxidoreductase [Actinoplanes sp. NPDC051411]|uniref:SDR family NAD(P)-dependent oxidoreductase n=1 Tax=Actinoplanes sp. NPDC051411 TaxID=3155522 RepID=UPI00344A97F1